MRSLIVLVVLAILVAGCVTPEQPVESASVDPPAASPAAAVTAAEAAPNATRPLVPRDHPFSHAGNTGTWACAPSGPNSCAGLPAGTGSSNTFVELEYEGAPSAVSATLTWEAATPATAAMYVSVVAVRSCGERCYEWTSDSYSSFVEGASPLTLDATGVRLADDEQLMLAVGGVEPGPNGAGPLYWSYSLEQGFDVEGVVTALVPAA